MLLVRIAIVISVACLAGCMRVTNMRDNVSTSDYRLSFADRLRLEADAPIIVLGRVIAASGIGVDAPSSGDPRVMVRLTKITIGVEQVVKGQLRGQSIEFYYFTFSSQNRKGLGVPYYLPTVGQRRIFFLRQSGSRYRSVGDLTDFTLRVMSGSHPVDFCKGKDPGHCMAELLLNPGPGLDRTFFPVYLNEADYAAGILSSQVFARRLMSLLADSSDEMIANSARQVLWANDH